MKRGDRVRKKSRKRTLFRSDKLLASCLSAEVEANPLFDGNKVYIYRIAHDYLDSVASGLSYNKNI